MTRRRRKILAAVALLAAGMAAARLMLPSVPSWFVHADPLQPCDLILVAGSNAAGSTEAAAVRLWRQGLGERLLCVGRPAAWGVREEEVMARHARALGVPADRVLRFHLPFSHAPDAGTMREERRLLLPYLRKRGVRSVLVISSELPSRRKALLLRPWRRAGLEVRVHPLPHPDFRRAGWWRRKTDTKMIVSETLAWLMLPFGH
jgi:uncharacterized SAM-binding protein YcdF (DUF218 family)